MHSPTALRIRITIAEKAFTELQAIPRRLEIISTAFVEYLFIALAYTISYSSFVNYATIIAPFISFVNSNIYEIFSYPMRFFEYIDFVSLYCTILSFSHSCFCLFSPFSVIKFTVFSKTIP